MPKRKPVEVKRVPLNCLVLPETLAWLKTQSSQGKGVDIAVAIGSMSPSDLQDWYKVDAAMKWVHRITDNPTKRDEEKAVERALDEWKSSPNYVEVRPFKGPLLKPNEKKK